MTPNSMQPSSSASEVSPQYPEPQILLIDLPDETESKLSSSGFKVQEASFGFPYESSSRKGFAPFRQTHYLPENIAEQDIVIIDLIPAETFDIEAADKLDRWIGPQGHGFGLDRSGRSIVDPRPTVMWIAHKDFDRILYNGGVFVTFVQAKANDQAIFFHDTGDRYQQDATIDVNSWGFLSVLERFDVSYGRGSVINLDEAIPPNSVWSTYLPEGTFDCTFDFRASYQDRWHWTSLATNKFGKCIAGALTPDETKNPEGGYIFLLPQIANKVGLIEHLIKEFLPILVPKLFPYHKGHQWTHRHPYDLPAVGQLEVQISQIREKAEKQIEDLERRIHDTREKYSFLYDLISTHDDLLVTAVMQALKILGFKKVIDVDKRNREDEEQTTLLVEDIWIEDRSPLLIIEVKGLTGSVKDTDALQVTKYLAPRMKQLARTDIQGLSLINHQRNIPAFERDAPFRDDLLTNAKAHGFGLMTTWSLFRLVRGFLENNWTHEMVADLLYQHGEIQPIPLHYQPLGHIVAVWKQVDAFGIIPNIGLKVGDRIAFDMSVDYVETTVESLQVDGTDVVEVETQMEVGIRTAFSSEELREKFMVYKIVPLA